MGKLPLTKINFDLTSQLCLLYLMAFFDRTNISNAKIDYLTIDPSENSKNMSPGHYNAALSIFFISYSTFQPDFVPKTTICM